MWALYIYLGVAALLLARIGWSDDEYVQCRDVASALLWPVVTWILFWYLLRLIYRWWTK